MFGGKQLLLGFLQETFLQINQNNRRSQAVTKLCAWL
jgi:hypothetical protein